MSFPQKQNPFADEHRCQFMLLNERCRKQAEYGIEAPHELHERVCARHLAQAITGFPVNAVVVRKLEKIR